jgi:negative regulator of sigma E activity
MPKFNPELIAVMRAALDETMQRVPARFATSAVKARVAECILLAAAQGVTNYDDFVATASAQMQVILSFLT